MKTFKRASTCGIRSVVPCSALCIVLEDVPTSVAVIVPEFTSLAVSVAEFSLVVSLFERIMTSVNLSKNSQSARMFDLSVL